VIRELTPLELFSQKVSWAQGVLHKLIRLTWEEALKRRGRD